MKEWFKLHFMSERAIDIYKRAIKTFIQAFLALFLAYLSNPEDMPPLKKVIVSSLAAGISAVMNLALTKLKTDYY